MFVRTLIPLDSLVPFHLRRCCSRLYRRIVYFEEGTFRRNGQWHTRSKQKKIASLQNILDFRTDWNEVCEKQVKCSTVETNSIKEHKIKDEKQSFC